MPVLPLVLGVILAGADPSPGPAGYRPSGSAIDLIDLGRLARLRDPEVRVQEFGPNPDGDPVLADLSGPGVIQQIRLPGAVAPEADDHLRLFLDDRTEPTVDLSLLDLFRGHDPRFPSPLVGTGPGGSFCSVPIPFRAGCRVVLDGPAARACRVELASLPDADEIRSFSDDPSSQERERLDQAVALWSRPASFAPRGLPGAEQAEFTVESLGQAELTFELPRGPRILRSLEVTPTPETAAAWQAARLRLIWESEDPADSAVDLPLGLIFGRAEGAEPYQSLLVGQVKETWYQRFPMPYRRLGRLRIDTEQPLRGTVRVVSQPRRDPDAGYFRARADLGAVADLDRLIEPGRGHLAGLFLAAEGPPTRSEEGRPSSPEIHALFGFPATPQATRPVAAYRWRLPDPLPFPLVGPIAADIDLDALPGDAFRAVVFWYSERPGPDPAGSRPRAAPTSSP